MNIQNNNENRNYQRTKMQKETIIELLRNKDCRITKQRNIILDIILQQECSCCKEIYYRASKIDGSIGIATIYRFVNTLEDIGAISRKNMYKVAYSEQCKMKNACTIELDDHSIQSLSAKEWNQVIRAGLKLYGFIDKQRIKSITVKQCECDSIVCED